MIPTPVREGYDFVGWFYMQNGERKAFLPGEMTVSHDLDLFAEWISSVVFEYTINYVVEDANGVQTTIAAPTTGHTFAGKTKTFAAKAGAELYPEYQERYYPTTNSHSLLIGEENEFTFVYTYLEKVPYTVRYVDKQTGKTLFEEKSVPDNKKAVVTETATYYALFAPIKSTLTITKNAPVGCTDHFLFRVTGDADNPLTKAVDLTVSIQGSGSVTVTELFCGDYTVTELTDWSWKYAVGDNDQDITLTKDGPNKVTFANTAKEIDWLSGEGGCENKFNAVK